MSKNRTTYYCHFHGHPGKMTRAQVVAKKCGEKHCRHFEENRVKNEHGKTFDDLTERQKRLLMNTKAS